MTDDASAGVAARAVALVALVGPRAAGKSTLARALGPRLGWPALDTDDLLAARAGCSAGAFLRSAGEAAFRALEEEVCLGALATRPAVVALGGGAVLSAAVREALSSRGSLVVLVEAPIATLVERQSASPGSRPPLTALPLAEEVASVLQARRPLYDEVAALRLDTGARTVEACVELVLAEMAGG